MWKEFKTFAMRGNVIDLAVGVVIGAAFTGIVNSLVNDIIMPPIGLLLSGVDFNNLFISLDGTAYPSLAAAQEAGAATLNYGMFINNVINFLIIAFVIFLVIRQMNRMKRKFEKQTAAKPPETKGCPDCMSEIPVQAKRCKYCTTILE
ncbi:large conductance mechanosensitive channel protein MscL [Xylanibacillus composti]|uniref:Large-conductance mechanosensitive channel n=1 Tax=Xylanibacillus composti TaxID=1572762 RepID=A0A8J4M417_9BACL|nr:large conductance mechanosensitive channel protein MscL [Xylanibacillus composti]MDT9726943.1 large conductance mechanosensitive channel protein MscL [Xylanibacillus composti]GIQ70086.1 large-conductance mechanosensitive channel [Xylanibacillus composti]